MRWPNNKKFVFTIFDDTDNSSLHNTRDVYSFLYDIGLLTTKSAWVLEGNSSGYYKGSTFQDKDYLKWLLELESKGFEIGYHMAKYESSTRKESKRALEIFKKEFDNYPRAMANHSQCRENIYWGSHRLTGLNKLFYNLITFGKYNNKFRGHDKNSKYFWGDLCKDKIRYVRNFVFNDINTLSMCPYMPYHDMKRPYVNYWFASSNGINLNKFNYLLSESNQDALIESGGACIVYTHFAEGFIQSGKLNKKFKQLMLRLSKNDGWFVPASTLLDFLHKKNSGHIVTDSQRKLLERAWLKDQIMDNIF